MDTNMGKLDRTLRILAAFVFVILFYTGTVTGTLGAISLVVAGVFLLTSIVGTCPLYTLLGIRTCPRKA